MSEVSRRSFLKGSPAASAGAAAFMIIKPELVRGAHDDLMRLFREGAIAPLVSRVVPLEDARDALVELADGRTVGKVVVTPS